MGWKNVKEYYRIGHAVQVRNVAYWSRVLHLRKVP